MAGTIHGSVDHQTTGGTNPTRNQELFTWIYNFFVNQMIANGYATMIATQYGTAGTGFDYHDGANPSGENAFFLVRMDTSTERPGTDGQLGAYYILVQWADAVSFGNSPGDPGRISDGTGDGVAICAAFREDGTSPWAGTTSNDGTDSKGATVWTAGGSTLHVMERSCSPGGSNVTNTENMIRIDDFTSTSRFHIMGDEDSVIMLPDAGDNTTYKVAFIGLYIPAEESTISYPMVYLQAVLPFSESTNFGSIDGNTTDEGLLVTADISGPGDAHWKTDVMTTNLLTATQQPNQQVVPNAFDEQRFFAIAEDSEEVLLGHCGHLDLMRTVFNVATEQANTALNRASWGNGVTASIKVSTPWGTAAGPRSTSTRAGRQF